MAGAPIPPELPRPGREEQARREIGVTAITRAQIRVVAVLALFGLFAVPVLQGVRDLRNARPLLGLSFFKALPGAARTDGLLPANRAILQEIGRFERELEDQSILTEALLAPAQALLTGLGGVGNEEAYPGRDGWLFYRPGIDSLMGAPFLSLDRLAARAKSGSELRAAPRPDPVPAIHHFAELLHARDIQLVVMPAPVKGQIHPEAFTRRYAGRPGAIHNPSYPEFLAELADPALTRARYAPLSAHYAHVSVAERARAWFGPLLDGVATLPAQSSVTLFEAAPLLAARRQSTGQPQYLATDTHWHPAAMAAVADALAAAVAPRLSAPSRQYTRVATVVTNLGDVAAMLQLPRDQRLFAPEVVTVQRVLHQGRPWQSDPSAEVLLLGDSFCNIYSLGSMGWGSHAGFAEQLAFALQRPVDTIIRNDAGAYATRELLMHELALHPARLDGKRVVIWEFAERELSVGDWKLLAPRAADGTPAPREATYRALEAGMSVVVQGTVAQVSEPPSVNAPYRDHVMEVLLRDVQSTDPGQALKGDCAYVALMSMRDKVLLSPAHLRVGDVLTLTLHHYQTIHAARRVQSLKSSVLDDESLLDAELLWGDPLTPEPPPGSVPPGWPEALALALTLLGSIGAVLIAEHREPKEDPS